MLTAKERATLYLKKLSRNKPAYAYLLAGKGRIPFPRPSPIEVSICDRLNLDAEDLENCASDGDARRIFVQKALASGLIKHGQIPLIDADPSLWEEAKNFASALRNHASDDWRKTPLPVHEARQAICKGCEYFNPDTERCRHKKCGCKITAKAWWASERCPIGKWERWTPEAPQGWPIKWDQDNFFPEVPGRRFNPSIIEWQDGFAFAFRDGWKGSNIWLARLTKDLAPLDVRRLELRHKDANYGREDPRLFIFQGRLHIEFIGVVGGNRIRHTNVLYARLNDDFSVDQVWHPHYPGRNTWEKNWGFFEHEGELMAVYTIRPHRILRIVGDTAELVHTTTGLTKWEHGEPRGGASPVLVGKEWWNWFHGRTPEPYYVTGLYCFANRPPFEVTRFIPTPLAMADRDTKPHDQWCSTTFVAGAVRRERDWITSSGEHDRWSALRSYWHSDLDGKFVPA